MEEHLRTTPCTVEPVFSVSHDEDSTLASLSQWRLAFLREQHLWRNWRKANFKTVEHEVENQFYNVQFITNDFIVSFYSEQMHLWDVRPDPPIRVDSLDLGDYYTETVFENGLIVLKNRLKKSTIKVLKVDVIQGTILPKYQFLFNKTTQTPQLVCSNTPVFNEQFSMYSFDIIIVKGRFCVGYFGFEADSNSFHIWDLESGIKLKQESRPKNLLKGGLTVYGSKTCDDVLVIVPCSVDSLSLDQPILRLQCQVYDVQNLCFFPFSQTCSVLLATLEVPALFFGHRAIINNFVALIDCGSENITTFIRIFNYRTDQQMYMLEANLDVKVLADACFIFTYQKYFPAEEFKEEERRLCSVFCPFGEVVEDVTGYNVENFEVYGNRLVIIDSEDSEDSEVWVVNRFASFKTDVKIWLFPQAFEGINKACTKVIGETAKKIQILHFW